MYLTSLCAENFRNYETLSIAPCKGTNLILGKNAQGKTNIAEAMCYLSTARSWRASRESELIRLGETRAKVSASLMSDREYNIDVSFGNKREILINGVKKRRTSELLGVLRTVLFCPEDLSLIREGAALRRRFLDSAICQLRPNYAILLGEYSRLLQHKTRILKDSDENPSLLDTLDDFSARMCMVGASLIPYRKRFLDKLNAFATEIHSDISGGAETLKIEYKTVSAVDDPLASEKEIYEKLWSHYTTHKSAEIASRSCLSGIHKDDILLSVNDLSVKTYGSQGQTRSVALALKLGQRDLFYSDTGHYPVLILDDVLSELDSIRRDYILRGISKGQVFITSCNEYEGLDAECVFTVENGKVTVR